MNTKVEEGTILGHPKGLFILFFTEMWERFSYYGMRALLMIYMTKYLLLEPEKARAVLGYTMLEGLLISAFGATEIQDFASNLYGLYTGFVYLSPLFGGMLADKILGQKKSVYVGGLLMAIGHFLMAFESYFLIALFFLILGNGAFKPNISTQVGNLYPPGDARRDGAFTIFYMGINLGATFSPLICGTLGELLGWHYGFGAAGIGMLLGLVVYYLGRNTLPIDKFSLSDQASKPFNYAGFLKIFSSLILSMISYILFLATPMWFKIVLISIVVAGTAYWLFTLTLEEREPVIALMLLCLGTVSFWTIFEQQGNTLQLWATDRTNWTIAEMSINHSIYELFRSLNEMTAFSGLNIVILISIALIVFAIFSSVSWVKKELLTPNDVVDAKHNRKLKLIVATFLSSIFLILISLASVFSVAEENILWVITLPSTWYQSFNPFFVIAFAPILNIVWAKSIASGKPASSSVRKMGIGCFLCGGAFIFMIVASKFLGTDPTVKGSIMWLALTTWIFTMGELYLSPIGLSLVTKVAPARILSTMMGMWFLSSFIGNNLAGIVGASYEGAAGADNSPFFITLCILGMITGVLFMLAEKPLKKMIGNV